jgi:mono/diheme cytochrome c family protein
VLVTAIPRPRVIALGLGLLLGCGGASGPVKELSGERLYAHHCARCHGLDGKGLPEGAPGIDLTDPARLAALRDDQLERVITMGRPPRMPAFGNRFTGAALQVLVAHLRGLGRAPAPAGP